SSGFGRACAQLMAERGLRVYGTSRHAPPPVEPASERRPSLISMDVRDESSVQSAVKFVLEQQGRIDVLVNNAGFGIMGSIEETSGPEALGQFETNFFGVHRVCRHVLPVMRRQRDGLVINIGSIAGRFSLPFEGFYAASKHALAALTESMRMELAQSGIRVTLVEPGDFRTEFTAHRELAAAAEDPDSPYSARMHSALEVAAEDERHGADPRMLAELVAGLVDKRRVDPRYLVGLRSQTLLTRLRWMIPDAWFEKLLMSHYRV
ncbi:MAG TPA: SDR family oxidoreductase, partial [Steroidobacteraceae bacterium]|nr:SDR family oxidoreductase [Steroidobacteraceae bacterium]